MRTSSLSLVLVLLGLASQVGWAKDLSERLGVGYTNDYGISNTPSVAVRYYPNQQYGVQASIGVDTETGNSRFGAEARFIKNVFHEDNMNFYVAAGGGLVSKEAANSTTSSGVDVAAVFGGEFFIPGLDSLGFSFEAGAGLTSISSEMRFRTIGDSPLNAGIFFYF
jgi:hypothetical protein